VLRLSIVRHWPVLIAMVGGAACASAPAPAGTPAPTSPREPDRPAITVPSTSVPSTFTYTEGTSRYDLDQMTTIVVGTDGGAAAEDSLRTIAGLTLSVTGAATTITIDSMVITSVRDTLTPVRQLSAPVVVQAPILPTVQQGSDSTALFSTCDSMEEAARVLAGDVHVPIPVAVARAQTWRDSTTSTLCRGGIPLTVTRVSDFQISDVRSSGDSTVATVQRHTVLTLTGSGLQGSRRITVRGDGTSETVFTYDLRGGRFLGSSGQSELRLGFETIQQTEQVVQRSTSSVRLRPAVGSPY
jgi:hypothetical protein